MPRRRMSMTAAVAFLAVLGAAAALLPTQLGGRVGYVIVNGNSMEPALHRGDLVLTWQTGDYRPGDIVAYRQPQLGYVIHRIIAASGGRFTLQGDNNHFVDSYRPAQDEVIGEQWLRIPFAGAALLRLREPAIAAAAIVLGVVTFGGGRRGARKRMERPRAPARSKGETIMQHVSANAKDLAILAVVALLAFGLLAAAAFTRPTTHTTASPVAFEHTGEFGYFAQAIRDGVYDGTGAVTGDPIYTAVSDAMVVRFAYRFESEAPSDIAGTIRLDAEVTSEGGWTRTIPLASSAPFTGPAATVEGRLVLDDVTALIETLEAETGVVSRRYGVNIVARVDVEGTLAGVPFQSAASPALAFDLEPGRLSVSRALLAAGEDPYAPHEPGTIDVPKTAPATLAIVGVNVPVAGARAVALGGLGFTLLGIAALVFALAHTGKQHTFPELPPGVTVVRVRSMRRPRSGPLIDVDSLDDLVRIAARHDGVILQEQSDDGTVFLVSDRSATYRFLAPASTPMIGGWHVADEHAPEAA